VKLEEFRALVDAAFDETNSRPAGLRAEALEIEIRDLFTTRESDQAFTDVRSIIDDLGLRQLCDDTSSQPHLAVAKCLQQALRQRGNSPAGTSDWAKAIELSKRYVSWYLTGTQSDQEWIANTRVSVLSSAINSLRAKGYAIDLPAKGGIDVPQATIDKLAADIGAAAATFGHALAEYAVLSLAQKYSPMLARYDVGRIGATVQLDAKSQLPVAYLYQLGLRYFDHASVTRAPEMEEASLAALYELVADAIALRDLTSSPLDLFFARPTDIMRLLRSSAEYDAVFLVTQAKPAHVREYLSWLLSHEMLAGLSDKAGRNTAQVLQVALMLLDAVSKAAPYQFPVIDPAYVAARLKLKDVSSAAELLTEIFAHAKGVNQKLTFPAKDTDVDAAFRPLVMAGRFVMQPGPIGARAVANAALDWCRKKAWPRTWKKKDFDDYALGPLMEEFVRSRLSKSGVQVRRGKYSTPSGEGECDAVIETQKEVIFLELKSKLLTREARSGDDVKALSDLSQALVRPQSQAMERNAVLVEHGSLTLTTDTDEHVVSLNDREVLKVSLTRGDLGSLHDRAFVGQFLRLGCFFKFDSEDTTRQGELKDLHEYFEKLKKAADRAKEDCNGSPFPFERCWSLPIFYVLELLERVSDNESFSLELQRNRRASTTRRDLYQEYAFLLGVRTSVPVTPAPTASP
jgi:hypothetical protein